MSDFLSFPPLYPDQTVEVVLQRLADWANEGIDPADEAWVDTREGQMWQIHSTPFATEAARLYDLIGSEVPASAIVTTSWGDYLDALAATTQLERLAATPAEAIERFTGDDGTVIPAGTQVGVEPATPDADAPTFNVVNGGVIGAAPGSTASLRDDFLGGPAWDPAKWAGESDDAQPTTVSGGKLHVKNSVEYPGIWSLKEDYDLTDSQFVIDNDAFPSGSPIHSEAGWKLTWRPSQGGSADRSDYVQMFWHRDGTPHEFLIMRTSHAGTQDWEIGTVDFDAVAMRFWRFVHLPGDSVYFNSRIAFETSPDGEVWTRQHAVDVPFPITKLRPQVFNGRYDAESGAIGDYTVNAVNLPIPALHADLLVRAADPGVAGNVPANSIVEELTPTAGVSDRVNLEPAAGGTDPETDEALVARIVGQYGAKGGGRVADYIGWALDTEGVGRVTVIPEWAGPGTVHVIIATATGDPSAQSVIDDLQAALDPPAAATELSAAVDLPVTPVPVLSTAGFRAGPNVVKVGRTALVNYTALDPTHFTGAAGGTGHFETASPVTQGGRGGGLAPIGHHVLVSTATVVGLTFGAVIEFEDGYTLDGAGGTIALRTAIELAVADYVNTIGPGGEVVISQVAGRIVSVRGVHDVGNVTINGSAANLTAADSPPEIPRAVAWGLAEGNVP